MATTAVVLDNICLKLDNNHMILDGVCLTINQGQIYALCGPSGCGKTTLCQAILGMRPICAGQIALFPNIANTVGGLKIPGKDNGYMPQAICLYEYLTGWETLYFFAAMHGMREDKIRSQILHLSRLLQLHNHLQRKVSQWSGGQQRRLSLASAAIHSPRLLILDEPTVGVDPVMREVIWIWLDSMRRERKATVLITTHYLAEAERAQTVGFMRNGRLLMEGSPPDLMQLSSAFSLESAFYNICEKDREGRDDKERIATPSSPPGQKTTASKKLPITIGAMKALVSKDLANSRRHLLFLIFQAFLPLSVLIIFYLSIGRPLQDVPLGLVNLDNPYCTTQSKLTCPNVQDILNGNWNDLRNLSCVLASNLDSEVAIAHYRDSNEARQMVIHGQTYGWLQIPRNFSSLLPARFLGNGDDEIINLQLFLDNSNSIVSQEIRRTTIEALESTLRNFLKDCGQTEFAEAATAFGVHFHDSEAISYGLSIIPPLAVVAQHLMASALTADQLVSERESGVLERHISAGIPLRASILCQLLVHLFVMIPQAASSTIVVWILFSKRLELRILLAFFSLLTLQGMAGMSFGLLISMHGKRRDEVIQMGIAAVLPTLVLSGTLWPRESMPPILQTLTYVLPVTATCDLATFVVLKSTATAFQCLAGVVIPLLWSIFFVVQCNSNAHAWMMN